MLKDGMNKSFVEINREYFLFCVSESEKKKLMKSICLMNSSWKMSVKVFESVLYISSLIYATFFLLS